MQDVEKMMTEVREAYIDALETLAKVDMHKRKWDSALAAFTADMPGAVGRMDDALKQIERNAVTMLKQRPGDIFAGEVLLFLSMRGLAKLEGK